MTRWRDSMAGMLRPGAIAVMGALLLIGATILVVAYQESSYRAQKLQQVVAQSDILAASVTAALVFDDPSAAQDYVSALAAYPDLEAAAVYDARGRLVASLVHDGAQPPTVVTAGPSRFVGNRIFVTRSVEQNGETVGTIYLSVQIDTPLRRIVRYAGIVLLVTMAVLMLSLLGAVQQALARTNRRLHEEMAERARAEEALRQSQKMEALGQLAGGVAHDFNNLLGIVRGSLQLLQRRLGGIKPEAQRFMDTAMEAIDRAASVTQRVLAFSRRQTLLPRLIDLSALVHETLPLVEQSVGGMVTLETRLEADWLVLCDPHQMEVVILNLGNNARDAMPDGGTLRLETSNVRLRASADGTPDGDYVRLIMEDDGAGMSEQTRQRALDPFFTTKPPGKGTGLGLSMALGFVNQSNGHLRLDSTLGKGTRVTILMPRMQSGAAGEAAP